MRFLKKYNESSCEISNYSFFNKRSQQEEEKIVEQLKNDINEILLDIIDQDLNLDTIICAEHITISILNKNKNNFTFSNLKLNLEELDSYLYKDEYYVYSISIIDENNIIHKYSFPDTIKFLGKNGNLRLYECIIKYKNIIF